MIFKVISSGMLALSSLGSSVFAEGVETYTFQKDEKVDMSKLGFALAGALNAAQRCDKDTRNKLTFGNKIESLKTTSSRTGIWSYEMLANGQRPLPSVARYALKLTIVMTPVKEEGPIASDKPVQYKTDCKLTETEKKASEE